MKSITQVLKEGGYVYSSSPVTTTDSEEPKRYKIPAEEPKRYKIPAEEPKTNAGDFESLESNIRDDEKQKDFQRKMDLYHQGEAAKAAANMKVDTKDNKKEFASDYAREKGVAKKFPGPSMWDQAKDKITKFDAENPNAKWYGAGAAAAGLGYMAYKKIKKDRQMKKASK